MIEKRREGGEWPISGILRNQATSSEKTPQNPTTSHSTAKILTYAFLNVDMALIYTISVSLFVFVHIPSQQFFIHDLWSEDST